MQQMCTSSQCCVISHNKCSHAWLNSRRAAEVGGACGQQEDLTQTSRRAGHDVSDTKLLHAQVTQRDTKKLAEKERRQLEEAARLKEAALADDDNVFDVAFEQQGGGGAEAANTVSATDIKARTTRRPWDKEHFLYPSVLPAGDVCDGAVWMLSKHVTVTIGACIAFEPIVPLSSAFATTKPGPEASAGLVWAGIKRIAGQTCLSPCQST